MQEDLGIKISMLLDDELESEEALENFRRIRNDFELRAKWLRYNAARCALKGKSAIVPDAGFFDRVARALDQEALIVNPNVFPGKKPLRITSIVAAIAASVAVVGVIMWSGIPSSLNTLRNHSNQVGLVISTQRDAPAPVNSGSDESDERPTLPRRLNDYLITHNESTYTTGAQTMMPYARVISYSDGR